MANDPAVGIAVLQVVGTVWGIHAIYTAFVILDVDRMGANLPLRTRIPLGWPGRNEDTGWLSFKRGVFYNRLVFRAMPPREDIPAALRQRQRDLWKHAAISALLFPTAFAMSVFAVTGSFILLIVVFALTAATISLPVLLLRALVGPWPKSRARPQ